MIVKMLNDTNKSMGIGVDIESISRFQGSNTEKDAHFLNKIFTGTELKYCFSTGVPAQHLAARYAAKEAIIKALSMLNKGMPDYREIEIINDGRGVPAAHIKGIPDINILLSLSHSQETAVAFSIVTLKEEAQK